MFRVDDGCQRRQKHYAAFHELPAQCPLSLAVLQGVAQRHPLPTSGGALKPPASKSKVLSVRNAPSTGHETALLNQTLEYLVNVQFSDKPNDPSFW